MDTRAAAQRFADTWQLGWSDHDVEAITALYAEDAVARSMPFRPAHHGRQAIAEYVRWSFDGETPLTVTFSTPLVDGDQAAIEFRVHALEHGKPTALAGCVFVRFTPGGLAAETRDYWHTEA